MTLNICARVTPPDRPDRPLRTHASVLAAFSAPVTQARTVASSNAAAAALDRQLRRTGVYKGVKLREEASVVGGSPRTDLVVEIDEASYDISTGVSIATK